MVICVCAPQNAKDFEEHEKFMGDVTKILHQGRRDGAKRELG